MRKLTFYMFVVILVIILGITGCTKKEDVIKIGAILPLTGDAAPWGVPVRNAAQMAVDEINKTGGINGRQIEFIVEDSQCDPKTGVSAVQKLLTTDKPIAILGAVCSSVSLAVAPIIERNELVMISPASTNPKLTEAGDYFFRVVPSDDLRSKVFAKYIYEKGIKSLDILYINNEGGVGATRAFNGEYIRLGGSIQLQEAYEQDRNDFRSQLTKVKQSKAEAVVFVSYPNDVAVLLRQSKELNIRKPIYCLTEALDDPAVIKLAGNAAEGIEYILAAKPDNEYVVRFSENYRKKYGADPPTYAAEGYDVIKLLRDILSREDVTTSKNIKNALYKIKDYQGVSGIISFDSNGDVLKPMSIKRIEDGKPVVIKII